MNISLFLTSQSFDSKAAGQNAPATNQANALNASGFFGFLVDEMSGDLKTKETGKATTISTTLEVGGNNIGDNDNASSPAKSSLLAMSGEELLALLNDTVSEEERKNFEVLQKGENSLTISVKASETDEAVPFVLNGFFVNAGKENQSNEDFLAEYKEQLSEGLRGFLAQAQQMVETRSYAGTILTGYTPEQITRIGDEIAALVTELVARSHGKDDDEDGEHKVLQENDSSVFTENPVLGENLIKEIMESKGGEAKEELLRIQVEYQRKNGDISVIAQEHADKIKDLVQGFISLIVPAKAQAAENKADENTDSTVMDLGNANADQESSDALAAAINNIIADKQSSEVSITPKGTNSSANEHSQYRLAGEEARAPKDGDAMNVKDQAAAKDAAKDALPLANDKAANNAASQNGNAQNANPAVLMGQALHSTGEIFAGLFTPVSYGEGAYEQMGLGLPSQSGIAATGTAALLTQARSAGHPHPATQKISKAISKAAASGEDQSIRIQLDPPELGRVEIKMTFGKDKNVKAILTVEKPETHIMLQRDAGNLERVLQDIGLDADGGLSFELAEQGFDFDRGNERGGGHDKGGTGAGGEEAEDGDIIESEMTWHVDPDTGHMRYNIFA